jgi:hypothetical protein
MVFAVIGSRIARDSQRNVSDLRASIDRLSTANRELVRIREHLLESEQRSKERPAPGSCGDWHWNLGMNQLECSEECKRIFGQREDYAPTLACMSHSSCPGNLCHNHAGIFEGRFKTGVHFCNVYSAGWSVCTQRHHPMHSKRRPVRDTATGAAHTSGRRKYLKSWLSAQTRRTVTRICAPILSSRRRIVWHCAWAISVPFKPSRRNPCIG